MDERFVQRKPDPSLSPSSIPLAGSVGRCGLCPWPGEGFRSEAVVGLGRSPVSRSAIRLASVGDQSGLRRQRFTPSASPIWSSVKRAAWATSAFSHAFKGTSIVFFRWACADWISAREVEATVGGQRAHAHPPSCAAWYAARSASRSM